MSILSRLRRISSVMKRRKHSKNENEKYLTYVCEQSGWSREEAKKKMDEAVKAGISYKYYAKRKGWARTPEQLERMKRNMESVAERNQADHEHALEVVCAETGWDRSKAKTEIEKAAINCGSSFKDFYKFRLWQHTPEQQREFLTLKVAEKMGFKYNSNAKAQETLQKKTRFAKKFSDLLGRKWFVNRDISYEEFLEKIEGVEDLILKPVASTQGKGIEKVHCGAGLSDAEKRALYDDIMSRTRRMLCEECIVQHPDIAAFNPTSVNTIRVLTVLDEGTCYHVYAGFRMGRGGIVDNFHAGGIISSVDVKTGITCMDAIDLDGTHYPVHPVSGLPTKGFQIPHWDQVLEVTEKAARRIKNVGMVGWDVAVTENGVCLIEGNSEASYQIIQLPYVEEGIGMRKIFEPFLDK